MDTLGLVESRSIAAGALLADHMVKKADVKLLKASTICPGRFMIHIEGERDAVETSVLFARNFDFSLAGSFILSNVSSQVILALKQKHEIKYGDAVGIVESKTAVSGIVAADKAVKQATVKLARLVTANGICGKSYFIISGNTSSVEEATEVSKEILGNNLIEAVVLSSPDPYVVSALTGGLSKL
ncbi:MAG: propanediol utilization protein [Desulfobacteraceae bacterium 4572_19]|nr:MAG: propanediol utilization protein [Desulfobacteraceae bacterium 4572_19]